MDKSKLKQVSEFEWLIEPHGKMKKPGIIYASEVLIEDMDDKVAEQVSNVALLPGIEKASFAMPDAHWGYGFPIGGVAAFDPNKGGIISAGGVGFDISCGVRNLHTGLKREDIDPVLKDLADRLYQKVPVGVGSTGKIHLSFRQLDEMLTGGAAWAVDQGYGEKKDLLRIEEEGQMKGAKVKFISKQAKKRLQNQLGTLGSGNHYLEVQEVIETFSEDIAQTYALKKGDIVISIHCGSRGLGHQVNTEFLKEMTINASKYQITLPDRELACAPIFAPIGDQYLGAMRAAINCALANRQVITHLAREVFNEIVPKSQIELLYDVSHNTCKVEKHMVDGKEKELFVHRKGATRALGPGHPEIPKDFANAGQPVLIGGTMGTASYILSGTKKGMELAFASACHGAGRAMSRTKARKKWHGRHLIDQLQEKGILIRAPSYRGIAEEAPGAYKDVSAVVDATENASLARKVAKLKPVICIKG